MIERTPDRRDGLQEFKQPSLSSVSTSLSGVRGDGCLVAAACILGCDPESVPAMERRPMCSRNPWRTVRKGNKLITHRPDCMCWGCDECRPKLKEKWIWHATKVLGQGGYLGAVTVDSDEFPSFARKLRRKGGNYFRVRISERGYAVIVGMPTNPAWWTFRATPLKSHQAVELFTKWVNEIQDSNDGNPVSTSRSWSLPSRDHSDWDLIAIGPAPSAVRSAAFLALADFAERNIGGSTVAICSGETDKIDRLCDLIGSLANYPTKNQGANKGNRCSSAFEIALEDLLLPAHKGCER